MRVGFIGLGHMGRGMAANLLKAGHDLTVYNRSPGKTADLEQAGAKSAASIAEACDADAVFTMLSNDQAVESTVYLPGGVLASLPRGAIHISSSTISVALADRISASHRTASQRMLSATVLGRPDAAAQGKLIIIAAGPTTTLRDAAPLLDAVGSRTAYFGDTASNANLIKLSANFLTASVLESLGEALALVGEGGVDRRQYLDFLTSTVFDAPVYKTNGKLILDDAPVANGFPAALAFKDIRLAIAAGEALNVPLPLASLLHDRLVELIAAGGAHDDWSALAKLAIRQAGQQPSIERRTEVPA
jgi:3-hydroxyisobutyrate dehydrogenase-like beta-hydroxyacid dehydrogenase